MPVLSTAERRVVAVVVILGVLLLAGAAVLVVRWADVKAWLDAPEVLRVNEAALAVPLPGDAEDDPTRSAAASFGVLRAGWTDLAPREALEQVGAGFDARDVAVDAVLCDDPAIPPGAQGREVQCGLRVPAADEELWVLAADETPSGGVPLSRTAVWFAWQTLDMSWPLYERLVDENPYPYPYQDADGPPLTTPGQVETALPARYAGVTEQCWGAGSEDDLPCTMWEGPVDTTGLPDGDGQVEALVRELVSAGFFVDAADASWGGEPVDAHRFTAPGGWVGVHVTVRPEGDGLVARVSTL